MAKKKNTKAKPPKAPVPKSTVNAVELTNELKPRRDPDTGQMHLRKRVKDEAGKVVKEEAVLLDSVEGQELVTAVVSQMLRDTFADYDLKHANEILRGEAGRQLPQKPSNPIVETVPAEEPQKVEKPQKKPRPTFKDFKNLVRDTDVVSLLDSQDKVRVEIPTDELNGLSKSYGIGDERVRAWLFRLYAEEYGIPPQPTELRDLTEWLKSEAYVWGKGEPAENFAAANTLEDDAVFIAVRHFCRDLKEAGDKTKATRASEAYRDMEILARDEGADMRNWPERPSDLSAKLKQSPELLSRLNVEFTAKHERDGSYWTFERLPEPEKPTEEEPVATTTDDEDYMAA